MATRRLTVIAQVKDAASSNLKKIGDSLNNVNKAIKKSSVDFTEFNRVLFSTTAFVGLFTGAMDRMYNSLTKSGELERLSNQFERVVGPKGTLFNAINGMTKNSIDRMEAMRSAVSLSSLGITRDTKQLAELIARAGTAAKRAGLNSAEGIKKVTEFLKDGSVSHLSFLNVLSATNPALQAQTAILQKAGGVMGNVVSTQAKLGMGMAALRAATQGMEEDNVDLLDVVQDLAQSLSFLRGELGIFLGKALSPVVSKIKDFNWLATDLIERIRKTDQTLMLTVKNLFLVGSGLASVIASLGTARLFFKALGALGIGGIPFVTASLLGLAAAFTNVQKATESFTNIMKAAGAVLVGTFQLVSSFIHDSDNFAKGIGKMDGELHSFLQKRGLLELTTNIARLSSTVILFTRDVGYKLVEWFKKVGSYLDPFIKKIKTFFGASDPQGWARKWIEGGKGMRGMLINLTASAVAAYGALKVFNITKGVLGKLPIVGGLFGGKGSRGKGPAGTKSDPIYTKKAEILDTGDKLSIIERLLSRKSKLPSFSKVGDALKNGLSTSGLGSIASRLGAFGAGVFSKLTNPLSLFQNGIKVAGEIVGRFVTSLSKGSVIFTTLLGKVGLVVSALGTALLNPLNTLKYLFSSVTPFLSTFSSYLGTAVAAVARFSGVILAIAGAVSTVMGIFEGIQETGEGFGEFLDSIKNLGKAVYNAVENFLKTNTVLEDIYKSFRDLANLFKDLYDKLPDSLKQGISAAADSIKEGVSGAFNYIREGGKKIGGWMGIMASEAAAGTNALAGRIDASTASKINEQTGLRSFEQLGLRTNSQGKNEVAFVPTMPESNAERMAVVQQSMSQLEGWEKARMETAFAQALSDDQQISKEEWYMIFKGALDDSKLTKEAEKQAKKQEKVTPMSTQRC